MNSNYQNTAEHFHWGHFGAVALCAAFLISITVMRNGFQFAPLSSGEKRETVTYEQIAQKVESENPELVALAKWGQVTDNPADRAQLALLDPTQGTGNVLGASTGEIIPVQEYLTAEKLRSIKVKPLGYTSYQTVKDYEARVTSIETTYDALSLLGNFSTGSDDALQRNGQITPFIIAELTAVPVPTDVEEYHRLKIIYYTVLQGLADMKLGKVPDEQFADLSNMLMGVMARMTELRESVQQKHKIALP